LIIKIITIIIKIKQAEKKEEKWKRGNWELKTKSAGRRQNMARHVQPGVWGLGGGVRMGRGFAGTEGHL